MNLGFSVISNQQTQQSQSKFCGSLFWKKSVDLTIFSDDSDSSETQSYVFREVEFEITQAFQDVSIYLYKVWIIMFSCNFKAVKILILKIGNFMKLDSIIFSYII